MLEDLAGVVVEHPKPDVIELAGHGVEHRALDVGGVRQLGMVGLDGPAPTSGVGAQAEPALTRAGIVWQTAGRRPSDRLRSDPVAIGVLADGVDLECVVGGDVTLAVEDPLLAVLEVQAGQGTDLDPQALLGREVLEGGRQRRLAGVGELQPGGFARTGGEVPDRVPQQAPGGCDGPVEVAVSVVALSRQVERVVRGERAVAELLLFGRDLEVGDRPRAHR